MTPNITYERKTRDFGSQAVQKLQKQLAPEHFSFIAAANVRCLLFRNSRRGLTPTGC